jgi:hypothetical protein
MTAEAGQGRPEERVNAAAVEDQNTVEVPQMAVEDRSIADLVSEAIAEALHHGPVRATGLGEQRLPLVQLGLHQHAELEIEKKTGLGHVVDPATFRQDH